MINEKSNPQVQTIIRSVPYPRWFIRAAIFGSFFLLAFIAAVTAAICCFILQTEKSAYILASLILLSAITFAIAYLFRRAPRCPLCQGTPLLDSGAHHHEKAKKLPFLSHGLTNVLKIILTQRFRCMFCGQPYDLLKPVTAQTMSGRN